MGIGGAALRAVTRLWRWDAGETQEEPGWREGTQAVATVRVRERARVCGVLGAVTYSAGRGRPVLVGQLSDGTGRLDLVWLGQRRVEGIAPGRLLVAEGMVAEGRTRPRIYNPAYELLGT